MTGQTTCLELAFNLASGIQMLDWDLLMSFSAFMNMHLETFEVFIETKSTASGVAVSIATLHVSLR